MQGLEDAVFRNISACKDLSNIVRTSLGPNGRNKMVINHLEKLFVTNDAATIIRELEVVHPAAKLLVFASQQQQQEMGDQTNFVVILAGELLIQAENLLRMGLHPSEVISGFEMASSKALELLEDIAAATDKVVDIKSKQELVKALHGVIAAKQYGFEEFLVPIVAQACLEVMPVKSADFNVDNVRVVKILGASVLDTTLVRGMVFHREPEGEVKRVTNGKVAIFTCALDVQTTETKGTVLLHSANELLDFSKGEEKALEQQIKEISDAGVKVIVTGSGVGDLAMHFCSRYGLMVLKILSKFELQRLCRVTGATAMTRLGAPIAEEMGHVDVCETIEIGSNRCTVFRQEEATTRTATIVIRGGTLNIMDDVERAVDDAVSVVKALAKDSRLLPGCGATEMALHKRLTLFGESTSGLNQYGIKKFAEALQVIPRTLAENAGLDATDVLSKLTSLHAQDMVAMGVDIENEGNGTVLSTAKNIYDTYAIKHWAMKLASDAARTVLSVDQIVMSKPAGGPKAKENKNWDEDD